MITKPQKHSDTLLSRATVSFIGTISLFITFFVLIAFWYGLQHASLEVARGYAFTVMVVLQMMMVFFVRKSTSITSNRYLLLAVSAVLTIQVLIMTYAPLQEVFRIK